MAKQDHESEAVTGKQIVTGKLGIQHLYVKDQSAKVHHAPAVFKQEKKPETSLELHIENRALENQQFEVLLSLHLTVRFEQQTALVVEVEQAGVFYLENFSPLEQAFVLGAYCPGVLYPYARKVVSDLMFTAGFTPITSPPINFDHMYHERQKQAQTQEKIEQNIALAV